jgi:hypothetical protein
VYSRQEMDFFHLSSGLWRFARNIIPKPITKAIPPYTAHWVCPVMKLPGKILMPCKIHTAPAKINTTPRRLQKIRMIILPFIPIKGWFCWKIIHQPWCNPSIDSIRQIHCLRLVVVVLYGNLEVFCTHPPLGGVLLYPTKAGLALALIIPAVKTTPP